MDRDITLEEDDLCEDFERDEEDEKDDEYPHHTYVPYGEGTTRF